MSRPKLRETTRIREPRHYEETCDTCEALRLYVMQCIRDLEGLSM
jgi:hypothetical protein